MARNPFSSFRSFLLTVGIGSAVVVAALWAVILVLMSPRPAEPALVEPESVHALPASYGPTKVARVVPSATPVPTDTPTPLPTATTAPTQPPVPTDTPTRRPTSVPPTRAPTSAPTVAPSPAALPQAPAAAAPVNDLHESYGTIDVAGGASNHPAQAHADLNLALRSFVSTSAKLTLIDYTGATDPGAPQLKGLFADHRVPVFRAAYKVNDWNWNCDCRGEPITDWPVTLIGMQVDPNEILYTPDADTSIGDGYVAVVLYADDYRITLQYTREDSVAAGYTIHIDGIGVASNLLELYKLANGAGRSNLPALRPGQAFARARTGEIKVAVRDSGAFLDPRSRKDWWH